MMLAQSALLGRSALRRRGADRGGVAAARRRLGGCGGAARAVPRQGLEAPWRGGTLRDLARDVLAIARDGLHARARRDAAGLDESDALTPLDAIVADAPTQAEHWLARFNGPWAGDVRRIFDEAAV